MLNLKVTIDGDKALISGLDKFAARMPKAVRRGLGRVVIGVYREAQALLNGPGGKGQYAASSSGKKYWKKRKTPVPAGGYPVPVRTGHLKRSSGYLKPGESKTTEDGTFSAGSMDAIVYNSAEYAHVIHEGTRSSTPYGPRRFNTEGLSNFDSGDKIKRIIEEEIGKEL